MGCIEKKVKILGLPRWFVISWTTGAEREDADNGRNKKETKTITVERTENWEIWQKRHSGRYTEQRETASEGVTFRVKTTFSG